MKGVVFVVEKVTLKVSAAAAAYVRSTAPKQEKLRAARGEVPFCAADLGVIFFFLSMDSDPEVKAAAVNSLRNIPEDLLLVIVGSPGTHPKILDVLARLHIENAAVVEKLLTNSAIGPTTVDFLATKATLPLTAVAATPDEVETGGENAGEDASVPEDAGAEEIQEDSEEFLSKYKMSQKMNISQKIKFALTGDKEWRAILIRESNKLVSGAVVKNPRITDPEILSIAKSKIQNDEIMRTICMNKEWTKIYAIRKALVENSRTPLPNALRFMATLTEKDLAVLAKSKNVTTVLSSQALRLLLAKKH